MKKKVIIVLSVVLVVVALIGSVVLINQKQQVAKEKEIQQLQEQKEREKIIAEQERQKQQEENEQKLVDLEAKKADLEAKEISLKVQKHEEFMNNGFTQRYYELGNELNTVSKEIIDVEFEISNLKDNTFNDISSIVDNKVNMLDENEDEISNSFGVGRFIFVIPIVMFVIVFIVIIVIFIRSSKNMSSMLNSTSAKEMLNNLSDVAVKMAKDLNPSYEEFKCPNCGSSLDPENTDIKKCEYCGAKLYKTVNKGRK